MIDLRDEPAQVIPRVRAELARLGFKTVVAGAQAPHFDGPALLTCRLRLTSGRVKEALATGPDLCKVVGRTGVRVYQDELGLLAVEVPKVRPRRVLLADMRPWQLGLTAMGAPVVVDLQAETNAVLCGSTRSGKTTAMQVLGLHVRRAGARMVIADGKGRRWDAFARSASLDRCVARGAEESNALLAWVLAEVDRRLAAGECTPLLVLFADEAQLMDSRLLGSIAARCLEAGVRLVAGYQEPRADQVDPMMARQCGVRITGLLVNTRASRDLVGTPDAARLSPRADFLAVVDHAPAVRMSMAWAPQDDRAWLELDDGASPPAVDAVESPDPEDEMVEWAAKIGASARAIRKRFGIGQDRARNIRDAAAGMTDRAPTVIRPDFAARSAPSSRSVSHIRGA